MTKKHAKLPNMQRDNLEIQSTLATSIDSLDSISKSKGLSEILRDIRTLTYQICRIEAKTNQYVIWLLS